MLNVYTVDTLNMCVSQMNYRKYSGRGSGVCVVERHTHAQCTCTSPACATYVIPVMTHVSSVIRKYMVRQMNVVCTTQTRCVRGNVVAGVKPMFMLVAIHVSVFSHTSHVPGLVYGYIHLNVSSKFQNITIL